MDIEIKSFSQTGENNIIRDVENQDSYRIVRHGQYYIIVISDGAGGYLNSKQASFTACSAAVENWVNNCEIITNSDDEHIISSTIFFIQQCLKEKAEQKRHDYNNYCCTLLLCLLNMQSEQATILQIGDSFIYEYTSKTLYRHTNPNKLKNTFINSNEAIEKCHIFRTLIKDNLLLCSDGFEVMIRRNQKFKEAVLNATDWNDFDSFMYPDDTTIISVSPKQ